jgi:hypothetical protein
LGGLDGFTLNGFTVNGLRSPRRGQVRTRRRTKGRLICHARFQALAILALALTMIKSPIQAEALFIAAVGLAALEPAGLFTASRAAILLAPITVAAEIKHRAAGRKATRTLTNDCRTDRRHRFREEALDNRHRPWQYTSRLPGGPFLIEVT